MADLIFYDRDTLLPLMKMGSIPQVTQFWTDWSVQCSRRDVILLYLKSELTEIPLKFIGEPCDEQGRWVLPNDRSTPGWDFPFKSAGWLPIYGRSQTGEELVLQPPLKIKPASLTEEEFEKIVSRLEALAEFPHGVCSASTKTGKTIDGSQQTLLETVQQTLTFYRSLRRHWYNVLRQPWKDIVPSPAVVHVESPSASRYQRSTTAVEHRDRQHVVCQVPTESLDNEENRFLSSSIELLSRSLRAVIPRVATEADRIKQELLSVPTAKQLGIPIRFALQFEGRFQGHRERLQAELSMIETAGKQLEEGSSWARSALAHPVIRNVKGSLQKARPSLLRVANSIVYSPVYRAYQEFVKSRPASPSRVLNQIRERRIGRTWELYEIWVFLELYNTLVDDFGFRPQSGSLAPAELLALHRDDLVLPTNQSFTLRFHPEASINNRSDVVVDLHYNGNFRTRSSGFLCPDVLLQVTYKGVKKRFVVDAKYRRYEAMATSFRRRRTSMDMETPFEDDLCGTAHRKYQLGLECDAAFVMHSDPNPTYTFWGASKRFSRDLPSPHPKLPDDRPDHRFGALFVSPSTQGLVNLRKLVECFLMYHVQAEDVCWVCRRRIDPRTVEGWAGKYYYCEGHRFWVVSHCQGEEHRLIKLGRESFHSISPGNVWDCECPKCGNGLSNPRTPVTVVGGTYGPHTRVFFLHYEIGRRRTHFRNNERNRGTYYVTLPEGFSQMTEAEQYRYLDRELLRLGANINYVNRKKRLDHETEEDIKSMSEY